MASSIVPQLFDLIPSICSGMLQKNELDRDRAFRVGHHPSELFMLQSVIIINTLSSKIGKIFAISASAITCYCWNRPEYENLEKKFHFQYLRDHLVEGLYVFEIATIVHQFFLGKRLEAYGFFIGIATTELIPQLNIQSSFRQVIFSAFELIKTTYKAISEPSKSLKDWCWIAFNIYVSGEALLQEIRLHFPPTLPTEAEKKYEISYTNNINDFFKNDYNKEVKVDDRHFLRGSNIINSKAVSFQDILSIFDTIPWNEEIYREHMKKQVRQDREFEANCTRTRKLENGEQIQNGGEREYLYEGIKKIVNLAATGQSNEGFISNLEPIQRDLTFIIIQMQKEIKTINNKNQKNPYLEIANALIQLGLKGWQCAIAQQNGLGEVKDKYSEITDIRTILDRSLIEYRSSLFSKYLKNPFFTEYDAHDTNKKLKILGPMLGLWEGYEKALSDGMEGIPLLLEMVIKKVCQLLIVNPLLFNYNASLIFKVQDWINEGLINSDRVKNWFISEWNETQTEKRDSMTTYQESFIYSLGDDIDDLDIKISYHAVKYLLLKNGILRLS